jgi:hypothetical protein
MDAREQIQRILSAANHFEVLGLSPAQCNDPTSVRRAFQELSSPLRPDRCDDPDAARALELLCQANTVLGNSSARAQYLARLRAPRNAGGADGAFCRQTGAASPSLTGLLPGLLPMLLIVAGLLVHAGGGVSSFFGGPKVNRGTLKGILSFQPLTGVEAWQRSSRTHRIKYFVPVWWVEGVVRGGMGQHELVGALDSVADEMWIEHLQIQCEIEKNIVGKPDKMCSKRDAYAKK